MWTVLTPYIQTIPAWLHEQAQVWLGDRAFEYDRIPWAVPTAPGEVGAPMSQESQAPARPIGMWVRHMRPTRRRCDAVSRPRYGERGIRLTGRGQEAEPSHRGAWFKFARPQERRHGRHQRRLVGQSARGQTAIRVSDGTVEASRRAVAALA